MLLSILCEGIAISSVDKTRACDQRNTFWARRLGSLPRAQVYGAWEAILRRVDTTSNPVACFDSKNVIAISRQSTSSG
jgi:hypothetical protein